MGIKTRRNPDLQDFGKYRNLLAALSEDLSLPLMQIKTTLEAIEGKALSEKHTEAMALSAEAGLQLIEAYRLALKSDYNSQLEMEPVAIGAVLQEVAHNLSPYAKQYATDLEVDVTGKLTPLTA
jgi:signal transduction histidine kinase